MQDVNDDMDELFKKAAEHYPLNTNSSDWNEVHKALPPVNEPVNNPSKKNRSRRLLWLLLLLPFIIIATYVYIPGIVNPAINKKNIAKNPNTTLPDSKIITDDNSTQKIKSTLPASLPVTSALKKVMPVAQPDRASPAVTENIVIRQNTGGNSSHITVASTGIKRINKKYTAGNTDAVTPDKAINQTPARINKNKADNETKFTTVTKDRKGSSENTTAAATSTVEPSGITPEIERSNPKAAGSIGTSSIAGRSVDSSSITSSPKMTAADTLQSASSGKTKMAKIKNRQNHLYAGITGGPDLTAVKFQKIQKTGFTGGIIVGYSLNKWSIESGFYLAKKYYYTKGKYFNAKKIPVPYYVKIQNAEGDCNMIELPLTIKYNFKSTKKGSWFALAGSSSYLMKKEDYEYRLISNYGVQSEKQASYKNSTKDWFSILNVSAGYSFNVAKTGVFRVEPYIKIPLKGVGIGSLPIMSSGVQLGFTKNLF